MSQEDYVTGPFAPFLPQDYIDTISLVKNQNAFHVFISRGTWVDLNNDNVPDDDIYGMNATDCYQLWPGAFVFPNQVECVGQNPQPNPVQFMYGTYEMYLRFQGNYQGTVGSDMPESAEAIGRGLGGEVYHVLSVDHISPLQIHKVHANGDDGCDDTPWDSDFNVMGCRYNFTDTTKCAFSRCQLGRMHQTLDGLGLPFQRYDDGNGGYSMTPPNPPVFNCDILDPDIIIADGEDIVWSGRRHLRSNLVVESGGKLTIRCDLGMPEYGRIIVEPNGELIVDGARIHSNCGGRWSGIEVWGNVFEHQYEVNGERHQGFAKLWDGTIIENAEHGVRNFDPGAPKLTAGGVITAQGTQFLNNVVSAEFNRYQNVNYMTGEKAGDLSHFTDCVFLSDDGFVGNGEDFLYHARLHGVSGLRFKGCEFANDMSYAKTPNGLRGYGILSTDADFSVEQHCLTGMLPCTAFQRSEFRGLFYGISAGKTASVRTFRVSNADFNHNYIGISAFATDNIYAVLNKFKVGYGFETQNNVPYQGIHLSSGTGYKIEANGFEPSDSALAGEINVGIAIRSSGSVYNEVYRNSFLNMDFSNVANGDNRGINNNIGLQYLCNDNDTCHFDFVVIDSSGSMSTMGIAANQGSTDIPAENMFTLPPTDSLNHFWNEEGAIDYHWNVNKPDSISNTVTTIFTTTENFCLSRLPFKEEGPLSEIEKDSLKSDYSNSTDETVRTYAADMLTRQYLIDTADMDLALVRTWLLNKGDLFARFSVVDSWLQEEQPDTAETALDSIPLLFTLTGEDSIEFLLFDTLKSIQLSAMREGRTVEQMVAGNQTAIEQVAGAGHYRASLQARVMLNLVDSLTYHPEVTLPYVGSGQLNLMPPPQTNASTVASAATLVAVPNPARERTTFRYSLPDGEESAKLLLTDLSGRLLQEFEVNDTHGQIEWDASQLENGVYLASLLAEGTTPVTIRFVVAK